MDTQQGPTIQHKELCSVLCVSLDGRGVQGRMNTCTCMVESLCFCPPKTITTLLISYTPTQKFPKKPNKKTNKKKNYLSPV